MTSTEMILLALAEKPTPRAPVVPQVIQHGLQFSGATYSRYAQDAATMAQTVMASQAYYGYDAVYVSTDNYILSEAMGGTVRFPEDEPPQLLRHPMQEDDIAALSPFTLRSGRVPVLLEATRLCREAYGDTVFVRTNIDSAPFSAAASLRGPQDFLMDLMEDEAYIGRLLEICTDAVITYGQAAAQSGAHGLAFGDSVAGLVNRELYEKYALPWAQRAIQSLQKTTGLPVFYHVCGNTAHIADLLVQTGADCVEIDSLLPMDAILPFARGHCALMGNISTVETLLNGTPADVRREADDILSLFGNSGGLLLSSGCEVPRHCPRENIAEMIAAAREYPYGA